VPNGSKMGGIRESFLESFSGTLDFHFLTTPTIKDHFFSGPRAPQNRSHVDVLFRWLVAGPWGSSVTDCD